MSTSSFSQDRSRDASALFAGPLAWTEDLTVRFGRRTVLDRVNIAVQPGEVVTLIAADSRGPGEPVAEQVRELVRLNGLSGDQVVAGQELVVARG